MSSACRTRLAPDWSGPKCSTKVGKPGPAHQGKLCNACELLQQGPCVELQLLIYTLTHDCITHGLPQGVYIKAATPLCIATELHQAMQYRALNTDAACCTWMAAQQCKKPSACISQWPGMPLNCSPIVLANGRWRSERIRHCRHSCSVFERGMTSEEKPPGVLPPGPYWHTRAALR